MLAGRPCLPAAATWEPNIPSTIAVRPVAHTDLPEWRPLWDGYNAFYGRSGATALDEKVTAQTWSWFFAPESQVRAYVAEKDSKVVGMVHCVFHRSTTRLHDVCYLQDLYTHEDHRGQGVGRALIEHVAALAQQEQSSRLYWTTHTTNLPGRTLYDQLAEHRGFIVYSREL
jgi:GNAT superfamily N-acetyltransferase